MTEFASILSAHWHSFANEDKVTFLLGAFLGVLYVIDGWWSNVETEDFRKSPKVKTLIYILGLTGTGSLCAIAVDTLHSISTTLAMYEGFGITWAFGLIVLLILVFVGQAYAHWVVKTPGSLNPFLALGDALFHGYRRYRTNAMEAEKYTGESSLRASVTGHKAFCSYYAENLVGLVMTLHPHLEKQLSVTREATIKAALSSIRNIVEKFCGGTPGLTVNANFMRCFSAGEVPVGEKNKARFREDNLTYDAYLFLEFHAKDDAGDHFYLPVLSKVTRSPEQKVLFGAPEALYRKATTVISDTQNIKRVLAGKKYSDEVKDEITHYFASKDTFRTFISILVLGHNGPIGIVNVHASKPDVFGANEKPDKELADLLLPMCNLIGIVEAIKCVPDEHGQEQVLRS